MFLESFLEATKEAVFGAGAGSYEGGKYIRVSFQLLGSGQFMSVAAAGAHQFHGHNDQLEQVTEYRVEVICEGRDVAQKAVWALKK